MFPVELNHVLLGIVLGLTVGSFLNVVIYRLPVMLERGWEGECAPITGQASAAHEPFNLAVPASRCQSCGHKIAWYENIPLLSYIALNGRCSACGKAISWRYPCVEVATGVSFGWCFAIFGLTPAAFIWSAFAATLITLAMIDLDTTLLPDDLVYPLLWAGLIAAATYRTNTHLPNAIWGAVFGYLSLWLLYWTFKLLTGKQGMGYGDFKLFAALGAWFGWQALLPLIVMASVIGAFVVIGLRVYGKLLANAHIPFGPFLAGAGLIVMVVGQQVFQRLLGLPP